MQYPDKNGRFYILRCEPHGVHFKSKAIAGAAKHLDTELHGRQGRKWEHALETLGVEVLNCSEALMRKNNEMLQKDINEGRYKVLNRTSAWKLAKRSSMPKVPKVPKGRPAPKSRAQNGETSSTAGARRTTARKQAFEGVADPVGGEVYLGVWGRQGWYAVVLLPRGPDFGDPRFSSTGIPGTLRNTRLLKKVPPCYKYTPGNSKLSGWAKGYEDGGPLVTERRFPVIFFDAEEFPGRCSTGWIRAKNLRPYSRAEVPYLHVVDRYVSARNKARAAGADDGEGTSEEEEDDSGESGSESESEEEGLSDGGEEDEGKEEHAAEDGDRNAQTGRERGAQSDGGDGSTRHAPNGVNGNTCGKPIFP